MNLNGKTENSIKNIYKALHLYQTCKESSTCEVQVQFHVHYCHVQVRHIRTQVWTLI